jgi:hypothetical protein
VDQPRWNRHRSDGVGIALLESALFVPFAVVGLFLRAYRKRFRQSELAPAFRRPIAILFAESDGFGGTQSRVVERGEEGDQTAAATALARPMLRRWRQGIGC